MFHFRLLTIQDLIPAGFAKMHRSRSFDQDQQYAYHKDGGHSSYDRFDVELRVLSYDIVQQETDLFDKIMGE